MIFLTKYKLKRAISSAETFLRKKIIKGEYGLNCKNQHGNPMFSNNKGHCFSIFFLSEAFKNDLTEDLRSIFVTRILSEEFKGLWGYSPRGYYIEKEENPYFVDADDSAFVLRALRNMDIYRDNSILDVFLDKCEDVGGFKLYTTFKSNNESKIENIQINSNHFGFHPEVNANIYHLLLNTNNQSKISIEYIKLTQKENGQWPCFFYKNKYYSTCLHVDLIREMDIAEITTNFNKGISFLQRELKEMIDNNSKPINPYSISIILSSLYKDQKKDNLFEKGLDIILKNQNRDGSWTNNEVFWFFKDNYGFDWISHDINNIISTSCCLRAIKYLN